MHEAGWGGRITALLPLPVSLQKSRPVAASSAGRLPSSGASSRPLTQTGTLRRSVHVPRWVIFIANPSLLVPPSSPRRLAAALASGIHTSVPLPKHTHRRPNGRHRCLQVTFRVGVWPPLPETRAPRGDSSCVRVGSAGTVPPCGLRGNKGRHSRRNCKREGSVRARAREVPFIFPPRLSLHSFLRSFIHGPTGVHS